MGRYSEIERRQLQTKYEATCKKFKIQRLSDYNTFTLSKNILHKCHCGETWNVSPLKLIDKPRCNKCASKEAGKKISEAHKGRVAHNSKSKATFLKELRESGSTRVLVGEYTNCSTPTEFKCNVCNTVDKIYPSNVIKFGCRTCSGMKKKTTSEHQNEIKKHKITLLSEYKGANKTCKYSCDKCGFIWNYMPTNIIREDKSKCPSCSPKWNSTIKTLTYRKKFFKLRSEGELSTLKQLLRMFKVSDISADLSQGTPLIRRTNNSVHRPDFYIKSTNTLIEVKSDFTSGLTGRKSNEKGSESLKKLKSQRRSAIKQGFNYIVLIVDGYSNSFLNLPKNWYELSHRELKKFCSNPEHHLPLSSLKL